MDKLTKGQIQAILRALDEGVSADADTLQLRAAKRKLEDGLKLLKASQRRKEKMSARTRRP